MLRTVAWPVSEAFGVLGVPVNTRWPGSPFPVPAFPGSGCYDSRHSRGGTVPGPLLPRQAAFPHGTPPLPTGGPLHTSPPPNVSEAQGPCFPWACAWRLDFAILSQCWVLTTGHLSFGLGLPTCPYHSLDGNSPCWRLTPPPLPHPHFRSNESIAGFLGPVFSRLASPEPSPAPGAPSFSSPG